MDVATTITVVSTAVSAAAAVVSTVAAVVIVRLTNKTLPVYQKQLETGQEQIRVTQNQTFDQARPILLPPTNIDGILKNEAGFNKIKWGEGQAVIGGLQNIGVGPAFNIYGVLFPPPFQGVPPWNQRYVIWNYAFLPPGITGPDITLSQGSSLRSESTFNGHVLYVPTDPQHIGRIARLTLTYHDIYGRKFASIYDYQNILGWICVAHLEGIEKDLQEMDEQEPMTQMSNQFFYNAGKRAQP